MFVLTPIHRYGQDFLYITGEENLTTVDADGTLVIWSIPEADFDEYERSITYANGRWDSYDYAMNFRVLSSKTVDTEIHNAKYSKMRI